MVFVMWLEVLDARYWVEANYLQVTARAARTRWKEESLDSLSPERSCKAPSGRHAQFVSYEFLYVVSLQQLQT